jgi:hypothetical protein
MTSARSAAWLTGWILFAFGLFYTRIIMETAFLLCWEGVDILLVFHLFSPWSASSQLASDAWARVFYD